MFPIIIIGLCFKSDNEFEKTAMWLKKAVMRKIGKRAIIKRINSEQTCLNIHSAQTQSFTIHFSFIRFVSFCRGIYSGQPEKLFPPLSKFFPVLGTFIGGFFKFSRFFSPPSNSSLFFNLDKIPPPGGREKWPEYVSLFHYDLEIGLRNFNRFKGL